MTQDKDYDYDNPKFAKLGACNVKPGHNAFPIETWSAFFTEMNLSKFCGTC